MSGTIIGGSKTATYFKGKPGKVGSWKCARVCGWKCLDFQLGGELCRQWAPFIMAASVGSVVGTGGFDYPIVFRLGQLLASFLLRVDPRACHGRFIGTCHSRTAG